MPWNIHGVVEYPDDLNTAINWAIKYQMPAFVIFEWGILEFQTSPANVGRNGKYLDSLSQLF